jgi:hypothetical protein
LLEDGLALSRYRIIYNSFLSAVVTILTAASRKNTANEQQTKKQ